MIYMSPKGCIYRYRRVWAPLSIRNSHFAYFAHLAPPPTFIWTTSATR